MKKFLAKNLTFSNVVALGALFVALGGVSYAAITIPRNSVGTKQIKNNAVIGTKIKNNSLTGADIAEGSLAVVKKATSAATATTATTATNATNATMAADSAKLGGLAAAEYPTNSRIVRVFKKMNAGDADVKLVENGTISAWLHCETSGGNDKFWVYAKTTVDGALSVSAGEDTLQGEGAPATFLNTTTVSTDSQMTADSTATGVKKADDGYDETATIFDSTGTKSIALAEGTSGYALNHFGSTCTYTGQFLLIDA